MEKGKWYELWAAHEANVPMNFGKYIDIIILLKNRIQAKDLY